MSPHPEIVERVKELITDYLDANGIELVDITYRREQGGMTLRLLVDKAGDGISVYECEKLNNYLSEGLDKAAIIDERHLLEVSSPGLDRPLKTDRDFERSMGKELNVTTYEPIDMKREHYGRLIGMDEDKIVIESEGVSTIIPRDKIAKAQLKIRFP
ncbi:MAG: hypothetical protein A2987_07280 [Omnitrophica bacterium RIFCSPLOWO2_01_FULL_45_10]|nr:MAG: hypothetical protein A2987_07280 [Omnitrophica bacterium RIFCSPLOWO2_01_FULL_45_10]